MYRVYAIRYVKAWFGKRPWKFELKFQMQKKCNDYKDHIQAIVFDRTAWPGFMSYASECMHKWDKMREK